jgi:hypothetical protein
LIAFIFSTVILLILGISEQTGQLWFGGYFFIFAVVAYGFMGLIFGFGPTHLPVIGDLTARVRDGGRAE